MLNGQAVGRVCKLTYLGGEFTDTGTIDADISARISKAAHLMRSMDSLWRLRGVSTSAKLHIFQRSVVPTLLYGSHSWAPTQAQQQRLAVFHMSCLRRMLGISRRDRWRNEAVLSRCKEQPIQQQLRQHRLQWLGHCHRLSDQRLTKQVLMAQLPGARPRQKPPLRWREDMLPQDVEAISLAGCWQKVARHRSTWHAAARGEKINPRALPRCDSDS